jgi:hypothetical protein
MKSIFVFLGVSIFLVVMSCEVSYNSSELINVEYKEGANVEEDLINESLNALKTQSDTLYLNLKNDSLNVWSAKAERLGQSTQRLEIF